MLSLYVEYLGISFTETHSRLQVFKFLKLPAEIRNKIYWDVLVKRYYCTESGYRFRQPPLTLVNKQIRSECLPVLYGFSSFTIDFERCHGDLVRLQNVWAMPPAMPFLINITKLNIRLSFGLRGPSGMGRLHVYIHMRKSELKPGPIQNMQLVYKPGQNGKDPASIREIYHHLVLDLMRAQDPFPRGMEGLVFLLSVYRREHMTVRALLYFAEKCPAAAEWAWMGMKTHFADV